METETGTKETKLATKRFTLDLNVSRLAELRAACLAAGYRQTTGFLIGHGNVQRVMEKARRIEYDNHLNAVVIFLPAPPDWEEEV